LTTAPLGLVASTTIGDVGTVMVGGIVSEYVTTISLITMLVNAWKFVSAVAE
jgi:hypothetical protein